ncbi:hypothetical protein K4039_16890 [Lyngbya sp. CCAP 1446/10]|uniref:hypothetical protein n=1 Tax=Lyngbya sp. CCAP 1446/10 TaxID=439293 RepID=UPI00223821D6|nr:hypothetical protein [Lyngbya sp. CCAP 1446/10]MCW6051721.1 hypothetical protein [Lyngbya sp. CCAP 1446/10]
MKRRKKEEGRRRKKKEEGRNARSKALLGNAYIEALPRRANQGGRASVYSFLGRA